MDTEQLQLLKTQAILYLTDFGPKLLKVVLFFWFASYIASWLSSGVRKGLEQARIDATLTIFAAKMVRYVVLVLAALSCLGIFGVQTTSFAAVLGAAGFAVGLAFQGTLSNFASGVMLLVFRPFKVGDFVNVAGISGSVIEIEMFTTVIDTADKRRFIVPNGSIFGSTIENVTHHPIRRFNVDVGVEYSAPIDATRAALEKAVQSVEGIVEDPKPAVVLTGLGASSVDWTVRGWAKNADFWGCKEKLIRAVKMELDAAGLGIPFQTVDINLNGLNQAEVLKQIAGVPTGGEEAEASEASP